MDTPQTPGLRGRKRILCQLPLWFYVLKLSQPARLYASIKYK
jgi:hypothetical protein